MTADAKRVVFFLPAAGYRNDGSLNNAGSNGNYWSASCYNSDHAWLVGFSDGGLYSDGANDRYYGRSVRLVCPAQ